MSLLTSRPLREKLDIIANEVMDVDEGQSR